MWAGLPVAGAVLVIWARSNFAALSNPLSQYLGTVSHSLYLWHWPLLTISAYFGVGTSYLHTTVLVILTFVMAHLSNRLIETPFRDAFRQLSVRRKVPLSLAALGLIGWLRGNRRQCGLAWPHAEDGHSGQLAWRATVT